MQIAFDIPDSLAEDLKAEFHVPLQAAAREAFAIEGYREGRLSLGDVAVILGLETRIEAQAWLAGRKVPLNYDLAALEADRVTLRELGRPKS